MYLRRVSTFALAVVLGAGLCAMGGCAPQTADSPAENASAESSSAAEAQQGPALTIGDKDALHTIEITNETQKAITAVAFLETETPEYTDLPFDGATEWADGEEAALNIPALASDEDAAAESSSANTASQPEANAQSDAQDDVMLRSQIDLKLTASDGSTYELHGIAPEGISEAALRIDSESNLAYLAYVNESGTEESTLATEKMYLEQKRAQEEAALQAAALDAANQKTAQKSSGSGSGSNSGSGSKSGSQSNAPQSAPSSPSYSSPSGGSQGSSSAPAPAPEQSEDQCVEGGVAFRD